MKPLHDKKSFFKYYTAKAAKLTLQETKRKWSTPLLFNDPFDNQFDLNLAEPDKELARGMVEKMHQQLRSPMLIQDNQFGPITPAIQLLQKVFLNNPNYQHTEEELKQLTDAMMQGINKVRANSTEINKEIRALMADISIFCLSQTNENILMWSHYAQNHTGAVVEFLSLSEVDSPLILAQPVRYSEHMPRLGLEGLVEVDFLTKQTLETLTLTKSIDWSYEQEWRIVSGLRDSSKPYEILPYAPEEIGAVYLGCRMCDIDKKEIIEMTKNLYPKAKVFQAEKHSSKFKLIFNEIN